MKSFFELLQEELDAMYTKPENIDTKSGCVHEIDILKAEVKRWKELAEYRLQLLMQMPENKPWVGLTDEEIADLWSWAQSREAEHHATTGQHAFAYTIGTKLKEKNHG
jgi:hypothetical protein